MAIKGGWVTRLLWRLVALLPSAVSFLARWLRANWRRLRPTIDSVLPPIPGDIGIGFGLGGNGIHEPLADLSDIDIALDAYLRHATPKMWLPLPFLFDRFNF